MIFSVALSSEGIYAQTEDQLRAEWIFNIASGVSWENESNITKYTIGVYSSRTEFNAIDKLAASRKIKEKPVEVIRYNKYEDIQANHIVYVTKNENAYLGFVYEKLKGKNVLIISDRTKQSEYCVVNFLKLDEGPNIFELNPLTGDYQKLKFSNQLLKNNKRIQDFNELEDKGKKTNDYSSISGAELRAEWILNIAFGIEWEDEDIISKYTIGVYSSQTEFNSIDKLVSSRSIKGKPVEVIKYTNYEDIKPNHIVYVTNNENENLEFVYEKLADNNVLIITDRSKQPEYSVINFVDEQKKFELNNLLLSAQNLKIFKSSRPIRINDYSEKTDAKDKAEWIFNIAQGITWEDENNISKYTFGVYSSKFQFDLIKNLSCSNKIKGKPIEVVRYKKHEDIKANHIVYVTYNENENLESVYEKLKGKNVLIITDYSGQPEYSVINLLDLTENSCKKFEINKEFGDIQRLELSYPLLKLGRSKELLQELYSKTNKKLSEIQKELEQKELEIKEKDKLLKEQEKRLKEQEIILKEQVKLLKEQEELLKQK